MTLANINVALCDGSVRFVKGTVNLASWRALGARKRRRGVEPRRILSE